MQNNRLQCFNIIAPYHNSESTKEEMLQDSIIKYNAVNALQYDSYLHKMYLEFDGISNYFHWKDLEFYAITL